MKWGIRKKENMSLYESIILSSLEECEVLVTPSQKDITELEGIQKRVIVIIRHTEKPSYEKTEKTGIVNLRKKKKMNKEGYDESIKMVSGKKKIDQELL